MLKIGSLRRDRFTALLPDRPLLGRLVALARSYLGFATGFAIKPVVGTDAVPGLRLSVDSDPQPRLGWNTWLTVQSGTRKQDAAEAMFDAEVVEAQTAARPPAAA